MAQQTINIGAVANDGTGDTWRDALDKVNDNFDELYAIDTTSPTRRVTVNEVADLPAASGGVITLADNTEYFIGDDVSIGTDRIVWGENTAITGLLQGVVTLTYTGSGDMFTITNKSGRLQNITVSATSGRVFSHSDNADKSFRVIDCVINADKLGAFDSTGANGSVLRFTGLVNSTFSTSGLTFSGGWKAFIFETFSITQTAGIMFSLGTATFENLAIRNYTVTLPSGSTFLSGATSSANILSNGLGRVLDGTASGSGTFLSGVAAGDDRWEFFHNNLVIDTRPDALLYMQSNATNTVISTAGVFVIVAGTRTIGPLSQFGATTAGRLTYNGVKPVRLPVTVSMSVEPVSGTNKDIAVRLAKNGTTIAGSARVLRVDSGSPLSVSMPWQEDMVNGDYLEVFISNTTDTTNLLVSSMITRIA